MRPVFTLRDNGATAEWPDGLIVQRVMTFRKQIVLFVTWYGVKREIRLGRRVCKTQHIPRG